VIGIVGGGLSGLFLLDLLASRNLDVILVESGSRVGGVARSRVLEGPHGRTVVDLGPQRVRLTPGLAEITGQLGLSDDILPARSGITFTIHHRGRLYPAPTSLRGALGTGLVSWPGKFRALADLVTPPPRPEESVADALRRKLGPEIHSRLAGPILGGLYGSDTERMDARHTLLPVLRRSGGGRSLLRALVRASRLDSLPVVTFRNGMGTLADALAERHADRILLNAPLRRVSEGRDGSAFRLHLDERDISVDQVVLTLPAPEASEVMETVDSEAASRLGALRYNPLVVVPLAADPHRQLPDIGSGFKETLESDALTRGVTDHGALFGRRGVYSAFLGGMGRESALDVPDEELMEVARADFRRVTGTETFPLMAHRTWMPAWDRSWSALDGLNLPPGIHLCGAFAERPGIPGRLENARRVVAALSGEVDVLLSR
jgi:protoporphyrinogen/coproporphyrinogen III oxidase